MHLRVIWGLERLNDLLYVTKLVSGKVQIIGVGAQLSCHHRSLSSQPTCLSRFPATTWLRNVYFVHSEVKTYCNGTGLVPLGSFYQGEKSIPSKGFRSLWTLQRRHSRLRYQEGPEFNRQVSTHQEVYSLEKTVKRCGFPGWMTIGWGMQMEPSHLHRSLHLHSQKWPGHVPLEICFQRGRRRIKKRKNGK